MSDNPIIAAGRRTISANCLQAATLCLGASEDNFWVELQAAAAPQLHCEQMNFEANNRRQNPHRVIVQLAQRPLIHDVKLMMHTCAAAEAALD